MQEKDIKVGKVVFDTFTKKPLTIQEITKTRDKRDTYVKGKVVIDEKSEKQTRHINDIKEL